MPSSPKPAPRRRASRPASDVESAASPSRAPKAVDVGTKRRALKKRRARQSNWLAWTVAAAITVVIAGAGVGLWTELGEVRERVTQKRATLADLNAQLEKGRNRLRALSSSSGKERVLVENGFIRPGERLLLFPKTTKPEANSGAN